MTPTEAATKFAEAIVDNWWFRPTVGGPKECQFCGHTGGPDPTGTPVLHASRKHHGDDCPVLAARAWLEGVKS